MATTIDELAERLEILEKRVNAWTTEPTAAKPTVAVNPNEPELFRLARQSQSGLSAAIEKYCSDVGIDSQAIPIQELRKRMGESLLKKGIKPEDNSFSREIIAMREE